MCSPRGVRKRGGVPGATVLPAPAQDVEAPLSSRRGARAVVPGAPVLPTPLQHVEVPVGGCPRAGVLVPGAAVGPTPLEHLEVPTPSGISAGAVVPRAPVRPWHSEGDVIDDKQGSIDAMLSESFFLFFFPPIIL